MKKKFITAFTLCLICFIMVVCFSKLDTTPNKNAYIPHRTVYIVGLDKLKNSIPSDEGLTIQGHRVQYDKDVDVFTITFDYIAPNHQGYMERASKTFQVTRNDLK